MPGTTLLACVVLLIAPAAATQPNQDWNDSPAVGLGPLQLRAQSPLAILRLSPTPETPVTLAQGQWQLGLLTSWNNYFDVDPQRYTIDAETLRFTMGAAYGLTPRLELSVSVPVSYRGGGILDRFIEDFEGLLKVPNEQRRQAPTDRYLILIRGSDGRTFELSGGDAGWGLEDTTASVRYQLARGTETTPALTALFTLKFPTGREASLYSSGGYDVAAGLSAGQRVGRFNLYGSLVVMHYATTEVVGVRLKPNQLSLFNGVEYRLSPRTSWLLQTLVTSPGAENFGDFSKNTYEVTVGFKHILSPSLLIEVSVLENLFIFDNSPDVGFHVGFVWRSARRTSGE
ncbi:MAG: DUF3187 family protein [Thermoanaerobaculaceae bacterium]|jgi:hypothetical protein